MRGHILILVENLSVPFDRRVWQESRALADAGYQVTVICPQGTKQDTEREAIDRRRAHPALSAARGGRADQLVICANTRWPCGTPPGSR